MTNKHTIDDLEKRNRELKKAIKRQKRRKRKLEEEIKRIRRENKNLEEEIKRIKREKNKINKENKDLKDQLARLQNSLPVLGASDKTAEAVGVPTSKVYYRRNRTEGEKRPTGGQPGHKGHGRKRPTPNSPPVIIVPKVCPDCRNPLGPPVKNAEQRRTITDPPPPDHMVYEIIYKRCWCKTCNKLVRGDTPWIPPKQEFGPFFASWIAYQNILGLSVKKVQSNALETYNIKVSEATILKMVKWVADSLGDDYEKIRQEILKAKAAGADETKLRVNGMNGWMWVFTSVMAVYYKISPTRSHIVPEEILKGYKGGLTRDAWKPYDVLEDAIHQLDLLHVNRWLEKGEIGHRIEPRSLLTSKPAKLKGPGRPPKEFIQFADGIRGRLKEAVEFSEREPAPTMNERKKAYKRFRRKMKVFLERDWNDDDAVRITKELRKRLDMLYPFVKHPEIKWHNNDAERAIRQGVLHRKVSGGRRTWTGAGILEVLLSVSETAKKRGIRILRWFQNALNTGSGSDSTS